MLTDVQLTKLHLSLRNPLRPGPIAGLTTRSTPGHVPVMPALLLRTLERCVEVVSAETGVSCDRIRGFRRLQQVVAARHLAMYVARRVAKDIWPESRSGIYSESGYVSLSRFFQRGHSDMAVSVRNVQRECVASREFAARVERLIAEVGR